MKRFQMALMLIALCAGLPLAAQAPAFSIGGLVTMQSFKSGGEVEFGFRIYEGTRNFVRNYVVLGGYGFAANYGMIGISDKFVFGGKANESVNSYAFIKGGFGVYGSAATSLLDAPYCVELSGGGGFEFVLSRSQTFFTEFGGGWSFLTGEDAAASAAHVASGFAAITVGSRVRF